ncbi:MAG: RluA family pseudouridine synthase [Burkholderiaceae bacterium]
MSSVVSTHQVRLETVDEASDGQRLDNFLAKICRGVPKSHLYQLIRSGQVRVNKGRAQADTRLALGDAVRIPPIRTRDKPASADSPMRQRSLADLGGQLPVVHEDDSILVIDKPPGTAAHGGSGVSSGVIERLRATRPEARFLELAHRLDRDTSGLLMLAKTRPALRRLHDLLRSHKVQKRYVAICLGKVPKRQKTIRLPLSRIERPGGDRAVVVDAAGKSALTEVTGLASEQRRSIGMLSLVSVRLETGRTHQIRVHLAANDFPLLGDSRYGRFDINRRAAQQGFARMYLHARDLVFPHPVLGHRMSLRSDWPASFAALFDEPDDDSHRHAWTSHEENK